MYSATDLLLFRLYILLEIRTGKYVLRIIVSNILQVVVVNVNYQEISNNMKDQ